MESENISLGYFFRRDTQIIMILATEQPDVVKANLLRAHAEAWGVDSTGNFTELLQRLAQHVLDHNRGIK